MTYKLLFLVVTCVVGKSLTAELGDCTIESTKIDFLTKLITVGNINDVDIYKEEYSFTGDLTVTEVDSSELLANFIVIIIEDSKLVVKTTDQFSSLEETLASTNTAGIFPIQRKFTFKCGTSSIVMSLVGNIMDTNNHPPTFEKTSIEYIMPTPLMPKIDLTSYGDKIVATDIDLSTTDVTFTVDNPDFTVEAQTSDVKAHPAALIVSQPLSFSSDIVLTVTATDKGEPPLSSDLTITIKKDASISLPDTLKFSSSLYTFDYKEESETPSVSPTDGKTITIDTSDPEKIETKLDDETYFTSKYDTSTKTVTIESTGNAIKPSSNSILILTLTANLDSTSTEAAIVITLPPEKIINTPKFSASYYIAKYTVNPSEDLDTLRVTSDITVSEGADVTLEGDDHFTMTQKDDKVVIGLSKNLDNEILSKGEDIILKLTATLTDDDSHKFETFATVVVQLPEVSRPKFGKTYYTATYKVGPSGDTVKVDEDITIDASSSVKVEFDPSDYSKYFNIFCDETTKKCTVKVEEPLTTDIFQKEEDIVLNIVATAEASSDKDSTVLVINLPRREIPKFKKASYIALYRETDDKSKITIEDGPIMISSTDSLDVTVSIVETDYKEYVDITQDSVDKNTWLISSLKQIPTDKFNEGGVLPLTLQAVDNSVPTNIGQSALIIELPKKQASILQFEEVSYTATYVLNEEKKYTVEIHGEIKLKDGFTGTANVFFETDSKNFAVVPKDNTYSIQVNEELNDNTLISEPDVVLTLIATLDGVAAATATLVIQLPKITAPATFTKDIYYGTYTTDSTLISFDPAIELTGSYVKESIVTLTLPDDLTDYFELSSESPYNIKVKKALNIISQSELVLTIHATLDDSGPKSTATVVITLPEPPKFTQFYYTAKYEVTDKGPSVEIDTTAIFFEGDVDSIFISVESPYDSYFKVDYDNKKKQCLFTVIKPLDETDTKEIYVVLDAKTDESALNSNSAVVALRMEEALADVVPEFSAIYYEATYKQGSEKDTIELVNPIKIVSDHADSTKVELAENTYKTNFVPTFDGGFWTLTVDKKLEDPVLNEKEIIVSLQATIPESAKKGTATLIITLPNPDHLKATPLFDKPVYTTVYDYTTTPPSINPVEIKIITSEPNSVSVKLDDDFTANFETTYDKSSNIWSVVVADELQTDIIKDNKELVIPLIAHLENSVGDGTAVLVVTLPRDSLSFESSYYEATYVDKTEGTDTLTKTDIIVSNGATIEITGDYNDNFGLNCEDKDSKKTCTLIVTNNLEDSVITEKSEIILLLEASKDTVNEKATATMIISLPTGDSHTLQFTEGVYTADYKVAEETDVVTVKNGPIQVKGVDDATIEIKTGDYSKYFTVTPEDDHWILAVTKNLEQNIIDEEISLLITLVASKDGLTGESGLIITLPKKVVPTSFSFSQTVYVANYNEDGPSLEFTDDIEIKDDPSSVVKVELSGEYKDLFPEPQYKDNKVTVTVEDAFADDILKNAAITVDLLGTKDTTGETVTATIVVKLPKESSSSIQFSENVYTASYNNNGDTPAIVIKESISIQGDSDNTAKVTLSGDYNDYFKISYKSNQITITLGKPLPEDLKKSTITLTLTATKNTEKTTAALIIEVPGSNNGGDDDDDNDDGTDDKTPLIAAVAVLGVLLVSSLVGSAVFYYFKFKRGYSYDDSSSHDRFTKNSNVTSNKLEHPKRRPTGVIKFPVSDAEAGETTDVPEVSEKRKSVQFDTINIDELEIEKAEEVEDADDVEEEPVNQGDENNNNDDDDDDTDSDQDGEDNIDRRASKV